MSVRECACVCARPSRWVFCLFVYGDGDKNKHAETCCCRWRFVACSLATLLPASASSTSSCISSTSATETSAKQNAPENPLCLSQWRKGAVGACGVIAVHHLQQHLSANLFALVSIGAAAAAAAVFFAFHSASVWTVCNRFPLVLLSMCATRGGASACDILYAIHIPPPLTHECRLRCCLRLQLGNASTLTSAGHMHIRHSEAEAGVVRCPPTNTNTTSPGRLSRGRALRFAQW